MMSMVREAWHRGLTACRSEHPPLGVPYDAQTTSAMRVPEGHVLQAHTSNHDARWTW